MKIEELGKKLSKRFNKFCTDFGKELTLAFEPGKFLVSEAGSFLCSVNSIKQTTSTVFAQVDSGFNHFVRPMMYGSNHDIKNISNPGGMSANKLAVKLLFIYGKPNHINNLETIINNCFLKVVNFTAKPYVSALSILTDEEKESGVACIDIGSGSTSLTGALFFLLIF